MFVRKNLLYLANNINQSCCSLYVMKIEKAEKAEAKYFIASVLLLTKA